MTESPPRQDARHEALALLDARGDAERALTTALAAFQAQVQAAPSLDLASIVEAARPAFSSGLAFSAQVVEVHGRHKLRVTLMHAGGAELSTEEWTDTIDDLPQASGWMLAMLLGIPLATQARPVEAKEREVKSLADATVSTAPSGSESSQKDDAGSVVDRDVALEPLTPQEIEATHQRILALPQSSRQELTKAFREHFQVPRQARSIGDRITQRQHSDFIALFLEEAQGQVQTDAPAEPER